MTTRVAVLGLALAAMATFSRAEAGAAATVQGLRGEVARDKGDLGTKWKTERAELSRLRAERKAELAKVGGMPGTRADKTKARRVLREKYAQQMRDVRQRGAARRRSLREDVRSKSVQIRDLRRS